ncbi:MAG: hypothetical protein PHP42_08740 [Bacteroidota bacterium]|nr:hypothetical protein [Bacteroidota bacterium]
MSNSRFLRFAIYCSCVLFIFYGCHSDPVHTFDKQLVATYAELMVMYEKEKMVNKITDSLYQIKVADLFRQKNMTEEKFKSQIDEIKMDNHEWRDFLTQVTAATDSLKRVGGRK